MSNGKERTKEFNHEMHEKARKGRGRRINHRKHKVHGKGRRDYFQVWVSGGY